MGNLLVLKARAMKNGNHNFYEPPHHFNGEALANLNSSGSIGWSYSTDLPTVSTYNTRLTHAWIYNPTDWLEYFCPGGNLNNGFPYPNPGSTYYNHYSSGSCNCGFSCFAFVYEVGRQAGINWGGWTPGIAGDFITHFGIIQVSDRKVGDIVLYNFDKSGYPNPQASDFSEHVAIITQINSTDAREDMVISSFGAHEYFGYGVYECKSWGFHSTSKHSPTNNNTVGLFAPYPTGYWWDNWDNWDYPNPPSLGDIRIVRITN